MEIWASNHASGRCANCYPYSKIKFRLVGIFFLVYVHVEPFAAAELHVGSVDHPVLQVCPAGSTKLVEPREDERKIYPEQNLPECQDTHFVCQVQFSSPVEVEDSVEGAGMPGKRGGVLQSVSKYRSTFS